MKTMKYKLDRTREGKITNKKTGEKTSIFQIVALVDIPSIGVKAGDTGGFIEDESNLSQEGECWIFDTSVVAQGSLVAGHAIIKNNSKVWGGSRVFDAAVSKAEIFSSLIGNQCVVDSSKVITSNCYEGATIRNSELKNVTLWNGHIKDSFLSSENAHFWMGQYVGFHMEDSRFQHTGKRLVKIESHLSIINANLSNVRTFKLESPLHLRALTTVGGVHLATLESENHLFPTTNELMGNGRLSLLNKSKVVLKDSSVKMDGYTSGNLTFENCKIDTFGSVRVQKGGGLLMKDSTITEMASVLHNTNAHVDLNEITLSGDEEYVC